MTIIPEVAEIAAARAIDDVMTSDLARAGGIITNRDIGRAALLAALPHLGEPVAWMLLRNGFEGLGVTPTEYTGDKQLAEIWAEHPRTISVTPLYLAPPAPAVAVKPLTWRTDNQGRYCGEGGLFTYIPELEGEYYWSVGRPCKTLDEAKAAAQADYEARIRSALVDAPAPPAASASETPNSSPAALFAVTKEWFEKRAAQEGDLDVRAGKRVTSTIDLTPAELAELERLLPSRPADPLMEQMHDVLKAYEAWEGDLVLNGDWSDDTPRLTQEQNDRLIEIQSMRNAALDAYKARKSGGAS